MGDDTNCFGTKVFNKSRILRYIQPTSLTNIIICDKQTIVFCKEAIQGSSGQSYDYTTSGLQPIIRKYTLCPKFVEVNSSIDMKSLS